MQRVNREDGAIAVIVGVSLLVLVGIGAFVVDAGNLYWERRQLQNGADAAALAAAQGLVGGDSEAAAYTVARYYADANNSRGAYVRGPAEGDPGFVVDSNSVTVTARTGSYVSEGSLDSFLARVLGVDSYATQASATASWGSLGSADTIPLTFSECEWHQMTGLLGKEDEDPADFLPTGQRTVYFHSTKTAQEEFSCGYDAPNHDHPGGFGWLSAEGGACEAYVENGTVKTDTGNNVPKECSASFLASLIGKTVAMPIFSSVTLQGSNATYTISGFAAFEMSGYHLSGNKEYHYPQDKPPCKGNDRCIRGRFVDYWSLDGVPYEGGKDYGAYVIGLTG
jgi:Flp pilus assembly protein TadG